MSWYEILDPTGLVVSRVFVTNLADLAANTPPGHTVRPASPSPEVEA